MSRIKTGRTPAAHLSGGPLRARTTPLPGRGRGQATPQMQRRQPWLPAPQPHVSIDFPGSFTVVGAIFTVISWIYAVAMSFSGNSIVASAAVACYMFSTLLSLASSARLSAEFSREHFGYNIPLARRVFIWHRCLVGAVVSFYLGCAFFVATAAWALVETRRTTPGLLLLAAGLGAVAGSGWLHWHMVTHPLGVATDTLFSGPGYDFQAPGYMTPRPPPFPPGDDEDDGRGDRPPEDDSDRQPHMTMAMMPEPRQMKVDPSAGQKQAWPGSEGGEGSDPGQGPTIAVRQAAGLAGMATAGGGPAGTGIYGGPAPTAGELSPTIAGIPSAVPSSFRRVLTAVDQAIQRRQDEAMAQARQARQAPPAPPGSTGSVPLVAHEQWQGEGHLESLGRGLRSLSHSHGHSHSHSHSHSHGHMPSEVAAAAIAGTPLQSLDAPADTSTNTTTASSSPPEPASAVERDLQSEMAGHQARQLSFTSGRPQAVPGQADPSHVASSPPQQHDQAVGHHLSKSMDQALEHLALGHAGTANAGPEHVALEMSTHGPVPQADQVQAHHAPQASHVSFKLPTASGSGSASGSATGSAADSSSAASHTTSDDEMADRLATAAAAAHRELDDKAKRPAQHTSVPQAPHTATGHTPVTGTAARAPPSPLHLRHPKGSLNADV